MEYRVKGNDIELFQRDFTLDDTLDCGQAFRWTKISDNAYSGFFLDKPLTITEDGNGYFTFKDTTEQDFLNVWAEYFDLNTDYGKLKELFSEDATLKKACGYAGGIRLLKQDSWEALCSFIISQNNNIPRIKAIINRMCEHYGHFPKADELAKETPESLEFLRAGFRAKYIIDAGKKIADKEINLESVREMPIEQARETLIKIKGVGAKVSECTLLFGMHRTEAFPIDVWIKRVLAEYYPDGFPEKFSDYAGIAQQYLFHYMRTAEK